MMLKIEKEEALPDAYEALMKKIKDASPKFNALSVDEQVLFYKTSIAEMKATAPHLIIGYSDFQIGSQYIYNAMIAGYSMELLAALNKEGISPFDPDEDPTIPSVHHLVERLFYDGFTSRKGSDKSKDTDDFLAELKLHINQVDRFGLTPAQRIAIKFNNAPNPPAKESIEKLMGLGADIFNKGNRTSLYDVFMRHTERLRQRSGEDTVDFLDQENRRHIADTALKNSLFTETSEARGPRL